VIDSDQLLARLNALKPPEGWHAPKRTSAGVRVSAIVVEAGSDEDLMLGEASRRKWVAEIPQLSSSDEILHALAEHQITEAASCWTILPNGVRALDAWYRRGSPR
jgi:hypothetical protein